MPIDFTVRQPIGYSWLVLRKYLSDNLTPEKFDHCVLFPQTRSTINTHISIVNRARKYMALTLLVEVSVDESSAVILFSNGLRGRWRRTHHSATRTEENRGLSVFVGMYLWVEGERVCRW